MAFIELSSETILEAILGASYEHDPNRLPDEAAISMYRRLAQSFMGDPIGPNFHATPIAAATALVMPDHALSAVVSISGGDCRVSLDGTAATAANGLVVPAGSILRLTGVPSIQGFSAIQTGAAATLDAVFFT